MDDTGKSILVIISVLTVTVGLMLAIGLVADTYYRLGQIDALTGHVYYELQTQDNGETVWVYTGDE